MSSQQELFSPAVQGGGEFYFPDVYADHRVPVVVKNNPVLYGECLGGALYCYDFARLAQRPGFTLSATE